MRRPVWLWIVIALYALIGLTQLRTVIHTALGTQGDPLAAGGRVLALVSAFCMAGAALTAAAMALRGDRRAIVAGIAVLAVFIVTATWATAVQGLATRWGALLIWVAVFSAMSLSLDAARKRGLLA